MPVHAGITILMAFFFFSWATSSLLIVLEMLKYGTAGAQMGQDLWTVLPVALCWILGLHSSSLLCWGLLITAEQ